MGCQVATWIWGPKNVVKTEGLGFKGSGLSRDGDKPFKNWRPQYTDTKKTVNAKNWRPSKKIKLSNQLHQNPSYDHLTTSLLTTWSWGDLLRLQYLTWPIFSPSKSDWRQSTANESIRELKWAVIKTHAWRSMGNPGCLNRDPYSGLLIIPTEKLHGLYNPLSTPNTQTHVFFIAQMESTRKNWKQGVRVSPNPKRKHLPETGSIYLWIVDHTLHNNIPILWMLWASRHLGEPGLISTKRNSLPLPHCLSIRQGCPPHSLRWAITRSRLPR